VQPFLPSIYAVTLFLSALLLFSVQPMIARSVLPILGGAPAVWNTAVVFFQFMLLAGYFYAFSVSKLFHVRHQAIIHLVVLCLAFAALPIGIPEGWTPPATSNPIPWLITVLLLSVGAPFFVLSATAPLLQRWFSHVAHPYASDPYFLYAPSNLGGLVALLIYPTLIEPNLRLAHQRWSWTSGFVLLAVLILLCAVFLWRSLVGIRQDPVAHQAAPHRSDGPDAGHTAASRVGQRARWLLLAFTPSSLLLGVTNFLSTDIAAIPLFWVVPLAIYLVTFVLVFARKPILKQHYVVGLQPLLILPLVLWFFWRFEAGIGWLFFIHLVAFFASAMLCHGELAKSRPPTERLTEFYLWISIGGVLGGAFNALIAPILFDEILEYPLAIILACLLLPPRPAFSAAPQRRWVDVGLLLSRAALLVLAGYYFVSHEFEIGQLGLVLSIGVIALVVLSFARRPIWLALAVGALLFAGFLHDNDRDDLLLSERSYFGVYKVERDGLYHQLVHGTTIHGAQHTDPERRDEPLTYYFQKGPLGQLFEEFDRGPEARTAAIIGLGAGAIACYGRPGERWTFYEIDPTVERIARNTRYFTYLRDCPPRVDVVIGDARITLANAPDHSFDMIVLDAFSSDAIPVHLITREAVQLYLTKLASGGLIALHITNRHINLEPVLERIAGGLGLASLVQADQEVSPGDEVEFYFESDWVVMGRKREDLDGLDRARWRPLEGRPGSAVWTDDFSDVFSAIEW
jgi:hypothetical protein